MYSTACVCSRLRRSARAITALYDDALAPAGLSTPQFTLLRTLRRLGPAPLSALALASGHDRTTLNRSLKPLEAEGLIRSKSGVDQRVRIVALTPEGEQTISRATPYWEGAQDRMAAILGKDRDQLFAILDRIEEIRA